jgi:hypothetical protein
MFCGGRVAEPEANHTPPPNMDVRNTLNITITLTHVVFVTCTALIFTCGIPPFEKYFTGNQISIMGVILTIYFSSQQEPKESNSLKQHIFPTSFHYPPKFSNAVPFSLSAMGCSLTDVLCANEMFVQNSQHRRIAMNLRTFH